MPIICWHLTLGRRIDIRASNWSSSWRSSTATLFYALAGIDPILRWMKSRQVQWNRVRSMRFHWNRWHHAISLKSTGNKKTQNTTKFVVFCNQITGTHYIFCIQFHIKCIEITMQYGEKDIGILLTIGITAVGEIDEITMISSILALTLERRVRGLTRQSTA